jgi:hypothetical protein
MNHCDFGTPMRWSGRFKSNTISCVAQRINFPGMSDDLRLLPIPWRIRLLRLVPMLTFGVVSLWKTTWVRGFDDLRQLLITRLGIPWQ